MIIKTFFQISLSDEQLKNTIYEVTSIDDLESKYPDVSLPSIVFVVGV